MDIGVLLNIRHDTNIGEAFERIRDMRIASCQICIWDPSLYTDANAKAVKEAQSASGVRVSAVWAGWTGPAVWDFYDGPLTLGLVPAPLRYHRINELLIGGDFAEKIGVTDVITHVGFLPENPNDSDYIGVVSALRYLAGRMKEKGQNFLFETGQETPTTLIRAIEDVGTGNLFINFDTANLILYGKANPADAARILGHYVRNTHCKDGEFPTDGRHLGREVPLGEGQANLPKVLEILDKQGYAGPLTIEREISGERQIRDIEMAREYLTRITAALQTRR